MVPVEAEICDFDDLVVNNNDVVLKNIAEDLQNHLPVKAVFNWEHLALKKNLFPHGLPDLTGKVVVGVGSRLDAMIFAVVHADICTQASLQKAVVVVMNNVFEYFLDRQEQTRAWKSIACNVRKRWSLLVRVPRLEESLSKLQTDIELNQLVEEMHLNSHVFMEKEVDREALEQIHLYRIL